MRILSSSFGYKFNWKLRSYCYSSGFSRPRVNTNSYSQLTENKRYQIYALKKAGHSQHEIAEYIAGSPSTISRELKRNSGLRGYWPKQAQQFSQEKRKKAHKARKVTEEVYEKIKILIRQELSPQKLLAIWKSMKGHHCITKRFISWYTLINEAVGISISTYELFQDLS